MGAESFLTFVLQVRKNPEKTSPRKLVLTGDRTRARCVTGTHATAVDILESDLREVGCDFGNWILLTQDRNQWLM